MLRAFLFAPSKAEHERFKSAMQGMLPKFPLGSVSEAAYRHAGAQANAFAFAQGVVVGALGNLFASSIGHWIDRPAGTPFMWGDAAWTAIGLASLLVIASMTWGALRRWRFNREIGDLFLGELRRRGLHVTESGDDPDELEV
jgi:hypothetical protein